MRSAVVTLVTLELTNVGQTLLEKSRFALDAVASAYITVPVLSILNATILLLL